MHMQHALLGGRTAHVDEAGRGEARGCERSACGAPLIARQGDERIHHFAHEGDVERPGGEESHLHLLATEIYAEARHIVVPGNDFAVFQDNCHERPIYEHRESFPPAEIPIRSVSIEHRHGDIIPDVCATAASGRRIHVEIRVTHPVGDEKRRKIAEDGAPTFEVDLSGAPRDIPKDELREILLGADRLPHYAKWLHSGARKIVEAEYLKNSEHLLYARSGIPGAPKFVVPCPLPKIVLYGKGCADAVTDCFHCRFMMRRDDSGVLCSGATFFVEYADRKLSIGQRRDKYYGEASRCPVCSRKSLRRRASSHGEDLVCTGCGFRVTDRNYTVHILADAACRRDCRGIEAGLAARGDSIPQAEGLPRIVRGGRQKQHARGGRR